MKNSLFVLGAAILLNGCAGVKVTDTQVASGASGPRAIYIRPFNVTATEFVGHHSGGKGERPIRQSLAGREFAEDLKLELETLAPAMVIEQDETPKVGWLVEGTLDVVDAGNPGLRALPVVNHFGPGHSHVVIHVRISEAGGSYAYSDKDASKLGKRGHVLYEFDLAGGSRGSGQMGSINAPGLGYSVPFDFKNAAERVKMALSIDPHRYGSHSSPTIN
ncbi:MAG: hypothetical protein JWL90_4101 [Chthoniobacteraceae bacterium]|nr:hypothetical protein [Chthoniobacteraceae bacterium]